MRVWVLILLLAGAALAQGDAEAPAPPPRKALNRVFKGEVVAIRNGAVTFHYDFEDAAQLEDFEEARPAALLEAGPPPARIEKGRLVLEGKGAIRHKMTGAGRIHARFLARIEAPGDAGTVITEPEQSRAYVFLDFFDRRFHKDSGLLLAGVGIVDDRIDPGRKLDWRDVLRAKPDVIEKHFPLGEDVGIEVIKEGWTETVRVGGMWRKGSSKNKSLATPRGRFGFWVHESKIEIDELYLTLTPPADYLEKHELRAALESAPNIVALPSHALSRTIKQAPLSPEGDAARRELSSRGEKGWKLLAAIVRNLKNKPYAAIPTVHALASGGEPKRRELLVTLYKRFRAVPELRVEIALALAPDYPENRNILHAELRSPLDKRVELFRALVQRGLADSEVKRRYGDALLAEEANQVLRARGALLKGGLGDLPKIIAKQGHSRKDSLAFLQEFAAEPNWDLVRALTKLLADKNQHVATGAYLILLTISDKDIAPDKDLWASWISAKRDTYKAPHIADPGPVAAAILRARAFLQKDLLEDGAAIWPTSPEWPGTRVGATALAVLALRAAGFPADDPAIQKALRETLLVYPKAGPPAMRDDLDRYTYALTLLSMALEQVDRKGLTDIKTILAKRIVAGQLPNGQWTYNCRDQKYAKVAKTGDNSNTQFAILALRALRRCGIEIEPEVWTKTAAYWRNSMNAYGGWGYGDSSFKHEMSMTAAGISTLAICAEGVYGHQALRQVAKEKRIPAGQLRLGELLLNDGYEGQEIYALYGVERACILTGTRLFNQYDWYKEGATILLRSQKESGAWGDNTVRGATTGRGYGEAVDTSFALLFLKRSTTGMAGQGEGRVVKIPDLRRPTKPR